MDEEIKTEISEMREEHSRLQGQVSILYSVISAIVENLAPDAADAVKNALGRPSRAPIDIGDIRNAVTRAQREK